MRRLVRQRVERISPRQLDLLERMALTWRARLDVGKQSPRGGEKRPTRVQQIATIIAGQRGKGEQSMLNEVVKPQMRER